MATMRERGGTWYAAGRELGYAPRLKLGSQNPCRESVFRNLSVHIINLLRHGESYLLKRRSLGDRVLVYNNRCLLKRFLLESS